MTPKNPVSIQFVPTGPGRVRVICRISRSYVLIGEYRDGILQDVTLLKTTAD
jgi:hypothetical protein